MRNITTYLFFFFLVQFVSAQDSIVVKGEIREKLQKDAIPNARVEVMVGENQFSTQSNYQGIFCMKLPVTPIYTFEVNHALYEPISKQVKYTTKYDTLEFIIEMIPIKEIEGVIVRPGKPAEVFGDSLLSVADFEILKDGNILLLAYPKRLDKGSELLLWDVSNQKILNQLKVPDIAEELVRDYRGNPHVVCEKNIFGIYVNGEEIKVATIEKEYFETYLSPILDTNKSKMYFSTFNKDYPEFKYFAYDQLDDTYTKIVSITDALMMELYRSEYKWADVRTKLWAKNKELETGIDAEIWVGAKCFTQSIYYKQLYAPMFHRNDSLFVFDYYKDQLMVFDQFGTQLDSVQIYHHYHPKETGWKKKLIQDRVTGQIYAVMNLAGYTYIRLVDTKTGLLGDKIQLEYRYIEKVEINNNQAYYIYRPFESVQKKFLYSEKLPFHFGESSVPQGDLH